MKLFVVVVSCVFALNAKAGWYQASDGNHYYMAPNTQTLKLEFERQNPRSLSKNPQAWQKKLESFLVSKIKKDMAKNAPYDTSKSKVVFDSRYGFSTVKDEQSFSNKRRLASKGRGFSGAENSGIQTSSLRTTASTIQDSAGNLEIQNSISDPLQAPEGGSFGLTKKADLNTVSSEDKGNRQTSTSNSDSSTVANNDKIQQKEKIEAVGSVGAQARQCQEVLTDLFYDYNQSIQILEEMYLAELEQEGCDTSNIGLETQSAGEVASSL